MLRVACSGKHVHQRWKHAICELNNHHDGGVVVDRLICDDICPRVRHASQQKMKTSVCRPTVSTPSMYRMIFGKSFAFNQALPRPRTQTLWLYCVHSNQVVSAVESVGAITMRNSGKMLRNMRSFAISVSKEYHGRRRADIMQSRGSCPSLFSGEW